MMSEKPYVFVVMIKYFTGDTTMNEDPVPQIQMPEIVKRGFPVTWISTHEISAGLETGSLPELLSICPECIKPDLKGYDRHYKVIFT